MWDTVDSAPGSFSGHLSHDLPCQQCGHAAHRYLPCDRDCGCQPALVAALATV